MSVEFRCLKPRPMATMRLAAIPFAGGGASVYRRLAAELPDWIELHAMQLPGHEDLASKPPLADWGTAIDAASRALDRLPQGRLALFGHSLGALLALDLGAKMAPARVAHLFCAARPWPGAAPPDAALFDRFDQLDDDGCLEALAATYGEAPQSFAHPEIRDFALPILRADLALLKSRPRLAGQLSCPLVVYAGARDPVTSGADLAQWRRETSGPFEIVTLPAGHYFLESEALRLADDIASRLAGTPR